MNIVNTKSSIIKSYKNDFRKNYSLYIMILPVVAFYIIFCYRPMYGLLLGFKDYRPGLGILGSKWVGLEKFVSFIKSPYIGRLVKNTVILSITDFVFSFPAPIILALLLNEISSVRFKKVVQTISYFPHFISTVVICGLLVQFSSSSGIFNDIRSLLGLQRIPLLQQPELFRPIYIASGIWQGIGWGSIIYLAAITGVDQQLYEAAALDGAGRLRRCIHVTLPSIRNTIVILIIMNSAHILDVGSEKILLIYNPSTYVTADVISTFVYRRGLVDGDYSFSTAIGFFNSVVSLILVLLSNKIADKVADYSLF